MSSSSSTVVTVATFNIKLGIQEGLSAITGPITDHAPDILAIQEIGQDWLMGPQGDSPARLADLLEMPHRIFVPTLQEQRPEGSVARYGHALFSRRPIENFEIIDLPQDEDEPRRMLRCQIGIGEQTVEVLSTHLSHLPSDRPDQGIFLRRWLDSNPRRDDARFLLGDLNATGDETWMADFLNHWIDADAEAARPTFPAHNPQRRIDYVLADGARLRSTTVPAVTEVSDHRPVVTRWALKPN